MRRRVIWLTIFALMLLGAWYDRLNFGSFCLLVFVGMGLVRMFDPQTPKVKQEPAPEPEIEVEDEPPADDVIRIRRGSVVLLRNSLMRHHNSRGADRDYQVSAAARETTEILQVLNVALASKPRRIPAPTHH